MKFTPPNAFNDPFEFMPRGYEIQDYNAYMDMVKNLLMDRTKYYILLEPKTRDMSYEEYLFRIANDPNYTEKIAAKIFHGLNARSWLSFVDEAAENLLFACFSEIKDNLLMWAHYAEMHKGIVIEFKSEFLPKLSKITYSTDRIRIPIPLPFDEKNENLRNIGTILGTTKSTDWSYEREWRSVCRKHEAQKQGDIFVFPFSPQDVVSIILGARISPENKEAIKNLTKDFPSCKIYQAQLHQSQFKLFFDPIQ